MSASNPLAGKSIDHSSLIDYAKKLIARNARGEPVAKDALKQARAVIAHRNQCQPVSKQ